MSATAAPIRTSRWSGTLAARRPLRWRAVLRGTLPPAVLAATTLAFCWKLLIAGLIVIGYDTMTYMYPYRYFAAEALREGHLPLWNPYIYFGVPFLANLQSAVFYPLHAIFLVLRTTQAMNWSVALHLFLAAYFTYLAGRCVVGLAPLSATVAGALYGFGGFVGAQVGHLNQLNAAAWVPAALCTLHLALARRQRKWVAATAAVLAIQLLAGHAQESYMTLVLLASYATFHVLWTAWRALMAARADGAGWTALTHALRLVIVDALWAFGTLGVAGALAGGIAAAQVLPTEELTAYSIRSSGMPIWEASAFSLPPRELFAGLLPTFGLAVTSSNEYLGWVGIGGLTLALLGVLFRAHRPGTLFFALVVVGSFMLALGNHFPLYERFYRVPGMNLFRVPARWLMLTTLSLSLLAGSGMAFLRRLGRSGWLSASAADTEPGPWRRLAAATRLLLGLLVVAGAGALLWPIQKVDGPPGVSLLPGIWLALGAGAVALAFWGLAVAPSTWPSALFFCWVLVELFAASRPLEYNNPNPESVYTASRPVIDALKADPRPERLLSVAATGYQPSDADQLVAGYQQLLGPNGVLATWINTKYKETLNPNLPMVYSLPTVDGYDGGVLPLRRYVELKTLFLPPDQNQPDGLLRDQLRGIPSPSVLRLLGVKYLLDDTISDVTRDGVYYDLSGSVTLGPGQLTRFNQIAALSSATPSGTGPVAVGPITSVGVVSALQGAADVPDGAPVLQVTLGGDAGPLWQGVLRAGSDTAEGAYTGAVRHRQPTPLGPAGAGGNASATYLARVPAASVAGVRWVEVQDLPTVAGQSARVSGITLIGQNGASWPVTVAGGDSLRLVHHSDVKLYLNQRALPRTYLVGSAEVAETPAAVLAAMGRPGRDPQDSAILERDPGPLPPARTPLRQQLRDLRDAVKAWLGVLNDPRAGTAPAGQALPAVPASSKDGLGTSTIVDETSERLVVRVEAGQPALLVVRDTYFPGWSATVDGAPAPLWRADYLFRAVPVPAGSHTVELRFQSAALERGAIVSVVAIFLTVLLAFFPLPRPAERALASSPEAGPEW